MAKQHYTDKSAMGSGVKLEASKTRNIVGEAWQNTHIMNPNQPVAASAALATSIDWSKLDLQPLVQAINQGKVGGPLTKWLQAKSWEVAPVETITGYLRLISGGKKLTLGPTDGKRTIAKAKSVFPGWIEGDFVSYGCDVEGQPTATMDVGVHEMVKDGDFKTIFGGLSDKPDLLCLTQDQIIQFVQTHRDWLRTDGYSTFFLFKVGTEFFVAHVYVPGGELKVHAYRFSHDDVWHAGYRHRVVVPQLAPSAS